MNNEHQANTDIKAAAPEHDFLAGAYGEFIYCQCKALEQDRQLAYQLELYAQTAVFFMVLINLFSGMIKSDWLHLSVLGQLEIYPVLNIAVGIVAVLLAFLSNQEFNRHMGKTISRAMAEYAIREFEARYPQKAKRCAERDD